jgi:hypothetical protein
MKSFEEVVASAVKRELVLAGPNHRRRLTCAPDVLEEVVARATKRELVLADLNRRDLLRGTAERATSLYTLFYSGSNCSNSEEQRSSLSCVSNRPIKRSLSDRRRLLSYGRTA